MRMGKGWESEFKDFKNELNSKFDNLKNEVRGLFWKFSSVLVSSLIITLTVLSLGMFYILDYKIDFTNARNETRFEKLEAAVYTPSNEAILNEIRELKAHYSGFYNKTLKLKKIRKAKPHK